MKFISFGLSGWVVALTLVFITSVQASIDVYEFSTDERRDQYLALTKELRCPKCQNQDIADSNAPIAQDMRREVHRMVEEGQSSEQVVQFMVDRFGEFVSYKPKVNASTFALWFGPYILLVLGLIVVAIVAKKAHNKRDSSLPSLSAEEQSKLSQLLDDAESPSSKASSESTKGSSSA